MKKQSSKYVSQQNYDYPTWSQDDFSWEQDDSERKQEKSNQNKNKSGFSEFEPYAFVPPILEKEERLYLLQTMCADPSLDNPAVNRLFEGWLRSTLEEAKQFRRKYWDFRYDYLAYEAALGLYKAIIKFKYKRNYTECSGNMQELERRFNSYKKCCIENTLKDYRRRELKEKERAETCLSIDAPAYKPKDRDDIATIGEMIIYNKDEKSLERQEAELLIDRALSEVLTPKQQYIIRSRFSPQGEITQAKIAKRIGCSKANVCKTEKRALSNLKKSSYAPDLSNYLHDYPAPDAPNYQLASGKIRAKDSQRTSLDYEKEAINS